MARVVFFERNMRRPLLASRDLSEFWEPANVTNKSAAKRSKGGLARAVSACIEFTCPKGRKIERLPFCGVADPWVEELQHTPAKEFNRAEWHFRACPGVAQPSKRLNKCKRRLFPYLRTQACAIQRPKQEDRFALAKHERTQPQTRPPPVAQVALLRLAGRLKPTTCSNMGGVL